MTQYVLSVKCAVKRKINYFPLKRWTDIQHTSQMVLPGGLEIFYAFFCIKFTSLWQIILFICLADMTEYDYEFFCGVELIMTIYCTFRTSHHTREQTRPAIKYKPGKKHTLQSWIQRGICFHYSSTYNMARLPLLEEKEHTRFLTSSCTRVVV